MLKVICLNFFSKHKEIIYSSKYKYQMDSTIIHQSYSIYSRH